MSDSRLSRFQANKESDKKVIEDAFNTDTAMWIVVSVIVLVIGWTIVDIFI